jgi:hypothetical protein
MIFIELARRGWSMAAADESELADDRRSRVGLLVRDEVLEDEGGPF